MASSFCWDPESAEDDDFHVAKNVRPLWQGVLPDDREMVVPQRWTAPFLVETARVPAMKIERVRDGLAVEALDGRPYRVGIPGTAQSDLLGQRKILPLPHGNSHWVLHSGAQDTPHRMVRFVSVDAAKT